MYPGKRAVSRLEKALLLPPSYRLSCRHSDNDTFRGEIGLRNAQTQIQKALICANW
jgi:hypothetical protein